MRLLLQVNNSCWGRRSEELVWEVHCEQQISLFPDLVSVSSSQEIEYWGINEFFLDSCCSYRYHDRKLESSRHRSWDEDSEVSSVDTCVDEISDLNR